MNNVADQLTVFITTYGIKIIGAIIILILGRIAAGIGRNIVKRILEKAKTDPAIIGFVGGLTYFLILIFAVLAALAKFGIQTASFVAILGAAGFAIGFALQGSLANFAAGVLILVLRPFRVGDYIDGAGVAGTCRVIGHAVFNAHERDELGIPIFDLVPVRTVGNADFRGAQRQILVAVFVQKNMDKAIARGVRSYAHLAYD